jgi:hypothetical protein
MANAPGLDAVAYRAGTWRTFRDAVEARLSSGELPALRGLRARDEDDFTIALIDGFAVMADVLTFYQERIANEAFLRTATERRSVLELARLLGYAPAPGVAAEAWLAFTLQDAPGDPSQAPLPVTIPTGTKTQSVPGPDETAQTFETVAAVEARARHNAIPAQTRARQEIAFGLTELYIDGTGHQLAVGDAILIVGAERERYAAGESWDVRLLEAVEPDDVRGHTRIAWRDGLGSIVPHVDPAAERPQVHVFRRRAALFGHNAPDPRLLSTNGTNLARIADPVTGQWNNFAIRGQAIDLDQAYERVVPGSWIALANATLRHLPSSTLGYVELYRAVAVAQRSRSEFGLASRVTHVDLDVAEHLDWFDLRNTHVLAESERLPLGERPVRSPVYGDHLALATVEEALAPGQAVAVAGVPQHIRIAAGMTGRQLVLPGGARVALAPGDRLTLLAAPTRPLAGGAVHALDPDQLLQSCDDGDPTPLTWSVRDRDGRQGVVVTGADAVTLDPATAGDEPVAEIATIARASDGVVHGRDGTTLRLASPLRQVLDRETVRVNANVAPATHGETVSEVLGSGDASRSDQRLPLKQAPLTYVHADTPSGRRSTLSVRVSGELWHERPTLFGAAPTDRVYTTETGDDGVTTAVFGDGVEGSRVPTGAQNVLAGYRKGLGLAGNVRAGQLTTLLARPLGVTGVTNPEPATGGEDPEPRDSARDNAPRTVLTLDRAVSLLDYEHFARAFAGIDKARATWIASGPARGVFLTVAGPAGATIDTSGPVHAALTGALKASGDPLVQTTIRSFRPVAFRLRATVKVADDAVADDVLAAARAAVLAAFSFDARDFGQTVSVDEVVAVLHRVTGVVAVDVDELRRPDQGAVPPVRPRLFAALPVATAAGVAPAELLMLDAAALELGVMA